MNEPAEQQQQEQQQPQQELQQQNAPVFIQPLPSQIKVNEAEEVELSVAVQGLHLPYIFLLYKKKWQFFFSLSKE